MSVCDSWAFCFRADTEYRTEYGLHKYHRELMSLRGEKRNGVGKPLFN